MAQATDRMHRLRSGQKTCFCNRIFTVKVQYRNWLGPHVFWWIVGFICCMYDLVRKFTHTSEPDIIAARYHPWWTPLLFLGVLKWMANDNDMYFHQGQVHSTGYIFCIPTWSNQLVVVSTHYTPENEPIRPLFIGTLLMRKGSSSKQHFSVDMYIISNYWGGFPDEEIGRWDQPGKLMDITSLVGGFNPFEEYWSKWESSPNTGENKTYSKPPPSQFFIRYVLCQWFFHPLSEYVIVSCTDWYCWWKKIHPAPVDMANDLILPLSTRFHTSPVVVWDFFHQQLLWFCKVTSGGFDCAIFWAAMIVSRDALVQNASEQENNKTKGSSWGPIYTCIYYVYKYKYIHVIIKETYIYPTYMLKLPGLVRQSQLKNNNQPESYHQEGLKLTFYKPRTWKDQNLLLLF